MHLDRLSSPGMNHESTKSPSLGMISTATRNTATVSPLSPLTNGNAVAQSANSGFAAALRQLAKQAEDPRGEQPFLLSLSQNFTKLQINDLKHIPKGCFFSYKTVTCSFNTQTWMYTI